MVPRTPTEQDRQREARAAASAMIGRLEILAGEAMDLSARATGTVAAIRLGAYRQFRRKYDDYRALVSLIEARLDGLEGDRADRLREEFRRLETLMVTILVRTAAGFFGLLAQSGESPLGAREVFEPEVVLLLDTRERLGLPEYAGRLDPALGDLVMQALDDLRKVVERVPALPDFDAPRGALPRPR